MKFSFQIFIFLFISVFLLIYQNCGQGQFKTIESETLSSRLVTPTPTSTPELHPPDLPQPVVPEFKVPTVLTHIQDPSQSMVRSGVYDYAPSVMYDDDGKYRMWWCAGIAGDYIGYSENTTADAFPNNMLAQYWPNRANGSIGSEESRIYFDGIHVCDPSVVKHNGIYYLYYGGGTYPTEYCMDGASYSSDGTLLGLAGSAVNDSCSLVLDLAGFPKYHSTYSTHIGVAQSTNGISWQRMNNGLPIVRSNANPEKAKYFAETFGAWGFRDNDTTKTGKKNKMNVYGAGQPSVIVKDNWFYMLFTDTTGVGRRFYDDGTSAGAGLYVIRSTEPTFQNNVEEVRCIGDDYKSPNPGTCTNTYWKKLSSGERPSTKYAVIESYSAELTYSDILDKFVIVFRNHPTDIQMFYFDSNFKIHHPALTLGIGAWRDGPAVLKRPDGHLLPEVDSQKVCQQIPLKVYSARGSDPQSALNPMLWDIWKWSAVINNENLCSVEQLARVYEGSLLGSVNRPLVYIKDGRKIFFSSDSEAMAMTKRIYQISNSIYDQIP